MMSLDEGVQNEIIQITGEEILPETTLDIFKQKLSLYINELINHNFSKLVQLLYRVDISETELKQLLSSAHENAGLLIADMIVERQLQKIKSRQKFTPPDLSSNNERW